MSKVASGTVAGVHAPDAPKQVSRRNAPVVGKTADPVGPLLVMPPGTRPGTTPDAGPATRFVASDSKATYRPSALIEGRPLAAFAMLPSNAMEISVVAGVHPAGPPIQVSRKKTSGTPLLSPATRLVASEANTTKRPLAVIEGVRLAPSAPVPINAAEIRTVCGVQAAPAP